ncbi:MAG: competence/damage-inducible protein A [Bacteroidetes bacterium]|nr:MAG: competence/damage-inducible protein A [Bacteroidota bacterium]
MQAEIISIGDELLIGQVVNTNASWMAEQLNMAGIRVGCILAISDQKEQILETVKIASKRSDIILVTGGLGPTKDDITKKTLCEFYNSKLVFNKDVFEDVKSIFGKRGFVVSEVNKMQAEVPDNCKPIRNKNGTAPGMWFEQGNTILVSMPGVPFEMKAMMEGFIVPELTKRFRLPALINKTVLTHGIGESTLAAIIEDWENGLPGNIKLAYLPQPGIVRLRLSGKGNEKDILQKQIGDEVLKLHQIIPDLIFGYDKDTMEEVVGNMLRSRKMTLATAESCTGGYISHLVTSVPGSSDYFEGSVVSYSNPVKEKALEVKPESLEEFGAVSEQVIIEMAEGVQQKLNTDYAIATSGIAGPSGGTEDKPIGTTWIAIATPNGVIAKKFHFGEHRGRNIRRAALAALNMLRKELL